MKILMIVPQPFFQPRGTPFSVYFRTRTLASMGHEIDLVTYHIGRDVTVPGVAIHRIPAVPFINKVKIGPSLAKMILDVPLFFKTFALLCRNRYDVVHAHEEAVFFCLVYKMFFWRLRVLYDMHSSLPQQLRNFRFSNSRLLVGFFALLEKLSLRAVHGVITICPELQQQVDGMNLRAPSVMIENTLFDRVDLSDCGDDVSDELINWDRFDGKKLVLYTGTFEHYQGLPLLLDSAAIVLGTRRDVLFLLIGGNPQQQAEVRRKANRLGIKDRVVLTGNLSPNSVKCFIRRADALVSPRIKGSNTPLKIYEYLASGKPIVATRHHTHTQVLSDKEAILTDCEAASFADGILRALRDDEASARVADQARALYRNVYGEEIYRVRLEEVLTSIKREPAPRGEMATARVK